jgi:inosine/xanthosine triphosphate pyrophosphatase family protein
MGEPYACRVARPIVLGTANAAKQEQLRWLLSGLPLDPVLVPPLPVAEDAPDLAGNAAAKALAYSAGGLAIASDGGLEAPALGPAWDPVLTRRQGQSRLRELASGLADRRAHWSEAVAIAEGGQVLAVWTESGTEGALAREPWPPPSDFWVWDIFLFPSLGKTWAALTASERDLVDLTWTRLRERVQAFFAAYEVPSL